MVEARGCLGKQLAHLKRAMDWQVDAQCVMLTKLLLVKLLVLLEH